MNKQDILNIICGNDKASIRMLYSLERQNGMNIDNHFSEEQNRKKGDYQELFWFRFIQLIFNNEIPYSIFYNSGESCKKSICKKTNCSHWSDNENWKTLDPENTKQSNVTYDPFSVVMDLCNYPSKYFDYREKTMEKVLTHHALSEWILAIYNNYKGHDGKVICTVHECEESNSPELYNFMTEHLKGYDDESNKKSAEYFRKIIDDFSYELVNSIRRIIGQAPITTEAISNDHINAILDDIKDPLVLIKSLIEVKFPGVISIENTEKKGVYCITWEGGKKYTGEVIDGKISGQGQIVFGDNGEWKEYSGEWNDGACHGKGKLLFKDGGYYDGSFVQNRANGFGTMIFSDDYPEFKEYSGNWKNDAWDGKGKLLFKDGRYYDGNFVQNRADGFGTMTFPDDYPEFKEYSGNWKNNAWDGKGKLLFKDGRYYDGSFVQNRAEGYGTITYPDDHPDFVEYSGNWKNNAWDGEGALKYKNGNFYQGQFAVNYPNGLGSYTFSNDDKDSRKSYIGQFVHDYFEGDGVLFYRGGMIEIGNYRNDLLVNGYLILLKWNRYRSVKVIDSIPGKKERIKDIKSYIENIIRDSPIKEQLLCAIKESGIFDSF